MFKPNYTLRRIFTTREKNMMSDYCTEASNLHHGLPMKKAMKLAYENVMKLNKNISLSWKETSVQEKTGLKDLLKKLVILP